MFTVEHAKSRRGLPHESILVRIEADDETLRLVNEGAVAVAEDKVEAMLERIKQELAADGGPLPRATLAIRVGADSKSGTFNRALKLGWSRNLLAKTEGERATEPTLYALADGVNA
jgi:hypothetical protein